MIDWAPLVALVKPVRSGAWGRPSYPPLAMLKALLLQRWYSLSDAGLEEALSDRLSFRRFCGFALDDETPDAKTIYRFRLALVVAELPERLFAELDRQLAAKGLFVKSGTLIDATLIEDDVKRPPKDEGEVSERDPDAGFTRRGQKSFFGYKADIGVEVGAVIDRHKMAMHFDVRIADDAFSWRRNDASIAAEARIDGLYVIRTSVPAVAMSAEQAVGAYKALEIRPLYHWLVPRVRAHVFLCMLAYYGEFHIRQRLAPLLFYEHDHAAAEAERMSIVAPAERSQAARHKAAARRTEDDLPLHSFRSLLRDLATLVPNKATVPTNPNYTFNLLTKTTPLQARAFELLAVSPGR